MPRFKNTDEALIGYSEVIMEIGDEVGSRQGDRTKEILFAHTQLTNPLEREILVPARRASIAAQIAETAWVLAGRNDVEWLSHYLPRAAEFSDDGETWRAGYGPRLRRWASCENNHDDLTDQLANVVKLLKEDRGTRRAVMSIWDPSADTEPSKDIPCNNWLHFISRLGKLHLHVAVRSNDLIWGFSGINAFEWSVLLEVVAKLTGNQVGELHFSTSSLHIYDRHWEKANNLSRKAPVTAEPSPRFDPRSSRLGEFDSMLNAWFYCETQIRTGEDPTAYREFPEPMLKSWLQVLAHHWTGYSGHLAGLDGTRLELACQMSPAGQIADARRKLAEVKREVQQYAVKISDPFVAFADQLHRDKSAVYGDSWKNRGELMSIIPNIARKMDRLGAGGAGDSSADTFIDALIYLLKYRLWLGEQVGGTFPDWAALSKGEDDAVLSGLVALHIRRNGVTAFQGTIKDIKVEFEELVDFVAGDGEGREERVDKLLDLIYPWAVTVWHSEQGDDYRGADHD